LAKITERRSLELWKREAAAYESLKKALPGLLDFVEKSMKIGPLQLLRPLRDESSPEEMRVVAALIVSASDEPNAEDRFVANVILTLTNLYLSWLPDVEEFIDSMICRSWIRVAQSEQFSLRAPSLNVGRIIAACQDDSCAGLRKAARVLLVVEEAVGTKIGPTLQDLLKKRAGI
jgi:hypothetical protein